MIDDKQIQKLDRVLVKIHKKLNAKGAAEYRRIAIEYRNGQVEYSISLKTDSDFVMLSSPDFDDLLKRSKDFKRTLDRTSLKKIQLEADIRRSEELLRYQKRQLNELNKGE